MNALVVLTPPKSISFAQRLQRQLDSEATTKDWTLKALTATQQHYNNIDNWHQAYQQARNFLNQA